MYEPDSDVVRWGLHFLDVDEIFNSGYYDGNNQQEVNISHEQYIRDSNYDTECSNVESSEMIAHTLQDGLYQLSIVEESDSSHTGEDHLQASTIAPDWLSPSTMNFYPGNRGCQEEVGDAGPSSFCSSPEDKSNDEEEYFYPLEITDESSLDGEVGKRLNQMIPIPHVLRTNGDIPSIDEATSDHQRLLNRLQLYDLIERRVQGDGNCQFCALSDQLYRSPEHHKFVRQEVVSQLESDPERYEGYVPMAYDEYLMKMSKSGEWGDHVTLQAAADWYGLKIFIITSFKDTCYIEIIPKVQKSNRVIFLSFWAEVHYNSIYPQGDLPPSDGKRKKRWWHFGNKH